MERIYELAGREHHGIDVAAGATSAHATCAAHFARLLHGRGLPAALGYLNERTRYRFTGLYRAEPPLLHNVALFDRENPDLDGSGAVAKLDETYCSITRRTGSPFSTDDALHDARLTTHAARDSVLCYSGVPIRLGNGLAWGTLCHFDLRPRLLPPDELAVLASVAPVVAEWLARQPSASRPLA
jgi:GAF domain-containing protein